MRVLLDNGILQRVMKSKDAGFHHRLEMRFRQLARESKEPVRIFLTPVGFLELVGVGPGSLPSPEIIPSALEKEDLAVMLRQCVEHYANLPLLTSKIAQGVSGLQAQIGSTSFRHDLLEKWALNLSQNPEWRQEVDLSLGIRQYTDIVMAATGKRSREFFYALLSIVNRFLEGKNASFFRAMELLYPALKDSWRAEAGPEAKVPFPQLPTSNPNKQYLDREIYQALLFGHWLEGAQHKVVVITCEAPKSMMSYIKYSATISPVLSERVRNIEGGKDLRLIPGKIYFCSSDLTSCKPLEVRECMKDISRSRIRNEFGRR